MPTVNENIFNEQVKHAIDIEGFKNGLSARTIERLNSLDGNLRSMLFERIGNVSQRGYRLSKTTEKRINAIIDSAIKQREKTLSGVFAEVDRELSLFATAEVGFQTTLIEQGVSAVAVVEVARPAQAQLLSATRSRPFQGRLLREWYSDIKVADRKRLRDAIRIGYQEGLTTPEIVQSIMGTRKNNFTDGILNKTRNEVNTVVRTATNHYANSARQSVFEENSDIITGLRYTATLDGRTSKICASLDGNVYDIDKGPRPPQHPSCRSIMVAELDGVTISGRRPYVSDTRTRKEREKDFRADAKERLGQDKWSGLTSKERNKEIKKEREKWQKENIGQTNSKTTFKQWFANQDAAFQKDYLGPTRYDLYKKGDMTIDKFVSPSGKNYTIEQLEARNAAAFKKAGLD